MKTKKEKRKGGIGSAWCLALGAAVVLVLLSGCENPAGIPKAVTTVASVNAQYFAFYSATKAYVSAFDYSGSTGGVYSFSPVAASTSTATTYVGWLFMTDTTSGRIYPFNPSAPSASQSYLVTTAGAAGEVKFYKGIGYVAVGANSGAGIYSFDPNAVSPIATRIRSYTPVSGTTGKNFQELIVGADGMLYAADNTDGKVLRIDPTTDTVVATIAASKSGTTGLMNGTYGSAAGVFVANTGGSIDFIANSGSTATAVVSTSIYPGRLVQLSNGNLVATGFDPSYFNHSYLVTLTGTPTATEIMAGSSSFGSLSVAYDSSANKVYIPYNVYGSSNTLYVLSGASPNTPSGYSVMTSTDNLANVAFYQN